MSGAFVTRFAPSPTGPLHLGHAYSAMLGFDLARQAGGRFLLRIEDIDRARARAAWEAQIFDDLAWLGLSWPTPVMRQSTRLAAYGAALDHLWSLGLLYPCSCSRRDIAEAAAAPQEGGPAFGPDGMIYPGTCRRGPRSGPRPEAVLRLDISAAMEMAGPLDWGIHGGGRGGMVAEEAVASIGDVVLARRDMGTSYHLSVVVDDAEQGITLVCRGADLEGATPIHVLLQRLLGLPTPEYLHHRLIRDETGRRLAKRDDARAIARYREDGLTPADIRRMVDLPLSPPA